MCFTKEWSLTFTITSSLIALWVLSGKGIWKSMQSWQKFRISLFFFYFGAMELLQFFQYLVINECDNIINHILTVLGWLHICWQPVFSNLVFSALDSKNLKKERDDTWKTIIKFAALGGFVLALRIIIPYFVNLDEKDLIFRPCRYSDEQVCGDKTCTTMGRFHLKWMFILLRPSYVLPNGAVHFVFMFLAPVIMGQTFSTIVLFLTGPAIAAWFAQYSEPEFASIWCFFSIAECIVTVTTQYLAIRKALPKTKQE